MEAIGGGVAPIALGITFFLVTGVFSITFLTLPDLASRIGTYFSSISVTVITSCVEFCAIGTYFATTFILVTGTLTLIY